MPVGVAREGDDGVVGVVERAQQRGGQRFIGAFRGIGVEQRAHRRRAGRAAVRQSPHPVRHHAEEPGMRDERRIVEVGEAERILLCLARVPDAARCPAGSSWQDLPHDASLATSFTPPS